MEQERLLKCMALVTSLLFCIQVSGLWFVHDAAYGQLKHQTSEPELGSISGEIYTNRMFGMTYQIPRGWHVDEAAMNESNAPTGDSVSHKSSTLLEISERPSDTPRVRGPGSS